MLVNLECLERACQIWRTQSDMDWLKDRLGLRHCLQDIVAIERQDSLKSLRVRLETNGALLRRERHFPVSSEIFE